jgi:uncharacterized protein
MSQINYQVPAELLEFLVCPITHSSLTQEGQELVASVGGLRYPIRNCIPVLLVDEAKLPEGIKSLDEFKAKFKDQMRP